jgi:hypothetical protein
VGADEEAAPPDGNASQLAIRAAQLSSKQRASIFWITIDATPHWLTGPKAEWLNRVEQGNRSIRGRQIGVPPDALLARKTRLLRNIGKASAFESDESA